MIKPIEPLVKRVPYVGPVISTIGLVIDIKDIVETTTPMGAAKKIGGRFLKHPTGIIFSRQMRYANRWSDSISWIRWKPISC